MKLPWIKFYASDWLSDEAVRSCSLEARGLWIDMLSLMAKSENHGHLLIGGKPATAEQLARIVGLTPQKITELMDELYASGVFSFQKDVIISRRMVKDEQIRKSDADRQMRFRNANVTAMSRSCHAPVTGQRLEARSQKPEARKEREREAIAPTRSEWLAYAKELGWLNKDASSAFDHYEALGWKIMGSKIENWKAVARKCSKNQKGLKNKMKPEEIYYQSGDCYRRA